MGLFPFPVAKFLNIWFVKSASAFIGCFFSKNMVFKHFWSLFPFPVAKFLNIQFVKSSLRDFASEKKKKISIFFFFSEAKSRRDDLTNWMLRNLATGNGNRLQKCLKTMFFEKKHPIKADADLTNRMLRILATGNGNRLQKCLKTMFFEKKT